jgi:hypothetical protein
MYRIANGFCFFETSTSGRLSEITGIAGRKFEAKNPFFQEHITGF